MYHTTALLPFKLEPPLFDAPFIPIQLSHGLARPPPARRHFQTGGAPAHSLAHHAATKMYDDDMLHCCNTYGSSHNTAACELAGAERDSG